MKRRHFLAAPLLSLAGCEAQPGLEGGFTGISHERGHLLRPEGGQARTWPAPSSTHRTRVLIAGAGVAGQAAARALRLGGMNDFALLELEDSAGGNSRAGSVQGVACPLGAHYLPVPGDTAPEVQDFLEELSLRRRVAGRWVYDERHLCHSPQERLFIKGQWQEGLLPVQDIDGAVMAEYQRFARLVEQASARAAFRMPVAGTPAVPHHQALDAMTFAAWLDQHQLTQAPLRWYLDYCCRDDYGAGLHSVSAWAGIHYFASRHGFHAPGEATPAERDAGVLTWPEGNGWLTRQLAQPLGERLRTGLTVLRVAAGRHGVEVEAFNAATRAVERWQADQCILALPLFVAARVVENPPPALREAAAALRYAPWLVANMHLGAALHDRPGAAPSWDNVIYGGDAEGAGAIGAAEGLGYVDAMHQSLRAVPGATVLTCYRALGLGTDARRRLYEQPWTHWRDTILRELSVPHPDLPGKATRMEITRYGHAMSVPVPGIRGHAALQALQHPQAAQRLHFAHADLSGYSVFEEAFTQGHRRGEALARAPRV
ncbi:MAG: NAD(P)-binding protein [Polaromonas sp.]|uniref:NAD(P)-binding protein n=1 Tax=Polaromonas sp. TaxID=1869339 RepID=UPI003267BD26